MCPAKPTGAPLPNASAGAPARCRRIHGDRQLVAAVERRLRCEEVRQLPAARVGVHALGQRLKIRAGDARRSQQKQLVVDRDLRRSLAAEINAARDEFRQGTRRNSLQPTF